MGSTAEFKEVEVSIENSLVKIFGQGTPRYERYVGAASLERGPVVDGRTVPIPYLTSIKWIDEGKAKEP